MNGFAQQPAKVLEFQEPEPIPKPTGKLLDAHGDTVPPPREGLMAKVDNLASERVEISKGTMLLLGLGPAFLMLVFSYGGSLLGWARDDQTQKEQIGVIQIQLTETRSDVKELNRKFDEIQKSLQQQAIQNASVEGYKLGQTDAGATGHKGK